MVGDILHCPKCSEASFLVDMDNDGEFGFINITEQSCECVLTLEEIQEITEPALEQYLNAVM